MKKILITGGCGFIGFNLTKFLQKKGGFDITIIDNISSDIDNYNERFEDIGIDLNRLLSDDLVVIDDQTKIIRMDIRDKYSLNQLFGDNNFDIVINLAAKPGVAKSEKKPFEYFDVNMCGFNNILSLSENFNVKQLIYASSSCVYGENYGAGEHEGNLEPKSYYGVTKLNNEIIANTIANSTDNKLKISGLRFFNVYGEYSRKDMALNLFTNKIKSDCGVELFNHGKNSRDLIYVGDVANAIYLIMTSHQEYDHEIFNIGSGESITNLKYYKLVKKILGVEHDKVWLADKRYFEAEKTKGNIGKMYGYFGWKPTTNLEDKLKELLK